MRPGETGLDVSLSHLTIIDFRKINMKRRD